MRASQGDATAWERWVYLFAQLRQLPVLAPHLPTANPRLRQVPCLFVRATAPRCGVIFCSRGCVPAQTAYELVLHAFLLAPVDHERLLMLLRAWPPSLYSIPALTEAVLQRCACVLLSCALSMHHPALEDLLSCICKPRPVA